MLYIVLCILYNLLHSFLLSLPAIDLLFIPYISLSLYISICACFCLHYLVDAVDVKLYFIVLVLTVCNDKVSNLICPFVLFHWIRSLILCQYTVYFKAVMLVIFQQSHCMVIVLHLVPHSLNVFICFIPADGNIFHLYSILQHFFFLNLNILLDSWRETCLSGRFIFTHWPQSCHKE